MSYCANSRNPVLLDTGKDKNEITEEEKISCEQICLLLAVRLFLLYIMVKFVHLFVQKMNINKNVVKINTKRVQNICL